MQYGQSAAIAKRRAWLQPAPLGRAHLSREPHGLTGGRAEATPYVPGIAQHPLPSRRRDGLRSPLESAQQEKMFRLEQLEIHGFKSFYDPAKLTFPAAMTAVVGPNGCGKSNICDALIWVLGENRAAHIRGETMEDVIFQGSARRRALPMGEVPPPLGTLNGDSTPPMADDGKIPINRRVFRDGQSEFRLNGKR